MKIPWWLNPWKKVAELQREKAAIDAAKDHALTRLEDTERRLRQRTEALKALTAWILTTHKLGEQNAPPGELLDLLK